jgi:hypothetical protein
VLVLLVGLITFGCFPKQPKNVLIDNIILSETKGGEANIQHTFKGGTTFYLSFSVVDFIKGRQGVVWLEEDLQVTGPDGGVLEWVSSFGEVKKFDYKNYWEINKKMPENVREIPVNNLITLPPNPAEGEYKILIILRDKIGRTQASQELFFKYLKPEGKGKKP